MDEKKVIEALSIIHDVCAECDCEVCPFGDDIGGCNIQGQTPECWEIKEKRVWRALC